MKNIYIELVSQDNANDIFKFEMENRNYFEESLPSRGDDYYNPEIFKEIIKDIEKEQEQNECYMYIIRNESGEMVGRVNFFSIIRDDISKAELGYRIGKNFKGIGYASEAVKVAVEKVFNSYNLDRIEAGTSTENFASQKVLIKNGFNLIKTIEKDIKINGEWVNSMVFEVLKKSI